jgi:hypothetical protein
MATTSLHEDYLGRDLFNEATNAVDFLGRATTSTVDFLGRSLQTGTWTATTVYALGTSVELSGGQELIVTVAGTSGASQPTAPAIGATVVDGTVTWRRTE